MKPQELKNQFIELRAGGLSYDKIAKALHIGKTTCCTWEREFKDQIDRLKEAQQQELYERYYMTKEARIKKLGAELEKINTALESVDFSEIAPERLLDFKLKYMEALKEDYTTASKFKLGAEVTPVKIVMALGDLLDRVRAGEVSEAQAGKESTILANLLKAYDAVELKTKIEALEAVIGSNVQ